MRRISFVAVGVLVALTGCTGPAASPSGASPTAASSPAVSPSAAGPSVAGSVASGGTALPGGCGNTPLWTGGGPDWTSDAGAGPLPFALSHEGTLFAGLFANPLRAGPGATNPNNRILWIVREPRDGQPLTLTLRSADGPGEVLTQQEPANSGPGEIHPSIVDVPTAGCWAVTAEWAGQRATLELRWV